MFKGDGWREGSGGLKSAVRRVEREEMGGRERERERSEDGRRREREMRGGIGPVMNKGKR